MILKKCVALKSILPKLHLILPRHLPHFWLRAGSGVVRRSDMTDKLTSRLGTSLRHLLCWAYPSNQQDCTLHTRRVQFADPNKREEEGKRRGRGQPAIFSMEGRKAKSILLKNSTKLNWPRQENHSRRWIRLVDRWQAVSLQCRRF